MVLFYHFQINNTMSTEVKKTRKRKTREEELDALSLEDLLSEKRLIDAVIEKRRAAIQQQWSLVEGLK